MGKNLHKNKLKSILAKLIVIPIYSNNSTSKNYNSEDLILVIKQKMIAL